MRLIALVSGGKDSILSMMLSMAHGHEIAYLANLHPPVAADGVDKQQQQTEAKGEEEDDEEDRTEDLDSHCFQTVGHRAVGVLADALGIPLRRAVIERGQSIQTGLVYDTASVDGVTDEEKGKDSPKKDEVDEVEVLYGLLNSIVDEAAAAGNPVQGVCSGAILSDYQRLRVEHICTRLGLFSYAYLWQMPQERVLDLAARLRVEALLIKVASMGLTPRKHLGKSLVALAPYLISLAPNVHAAGEGGEFETFVVDCPLVPQQRRLEVVPGSGNVVLVDDNPITPTGHWTFDVRPVTSAADGDAAANEAADPSSRDAAILAALRGGAVKTALALRAPTLRSAGIGCGLPAACLRSSTGSDGDDDASDDASEEGEDYAETNSMLQKLSSERFPTFASICTSEGADATNVASHLYVTRPDEGNMVGAHVAEASTPHARYGCRAPADTATSAGEQVRHIFNSMTAEDRQRVFYTMVFLPTLDAFAEINKVYVEFFGVSPPSRAVVECSALSRVTMDVYLTPTLTTQREVLHVQSISLWAAACIGPYAQANRVRFPLPSPDDASSDHQDKTRLLATAGMLGLEPGSMAFAGSTASAAPIKAEGTSSLLVEDRFAAEFKVCVENLSATLVRLGTSLKRISHMQVFVTADGPAVAHNKGADTVRIVSRLWRFAAECDVPMPPCARIVVTSALPKGALVEIMAVVDDAWATGNAEHQRSNPFWSRPGLAVEPSS